MYFSKGQKNIKRRIHISQCEYEIIPRKYNFIVSPLYLPVLLCGFNQNQIKNIRGGGGKFSRKFQKAKLEFAVLMATIYIAFTLYLQLLTQYLHCIVFFFFGCTES